ncbi:MAG: AAA family ATPase [Deltaproteobacteria bacterium]|nr:AAA family ATPase [Deltaproteobacteria bacterium]
MALLSSLEGSLGKNFLDALVEQRKEQLRGVLQDIAPDELNASALTEALREYNLAFRKRTLEVLVEVQDRKIKDLQSELGFTNVPPTSFNPQREAQHLFSEIQRIAEGENTSAGYLEKVATHLAQQPFQFVMFDLHAVLRRYLQLIGTQTLYLFFHEISKEDQKYPLFSVEVGLNDKGEVMVLEGVRGVLLLNTPAINNFEFDTILTTPRACRFDEGHVELSGIERFLQAKYNVSDHFLLVPRFRPLIREDLPVIHYRIGLQAVREEDRRILDYSELITSLDSGAGNKFIELISGYVEGNVESTADEVEKAYRTDYPRQSGERLAPRRLMVPFSLNESQKKILAAVDNGKNRIIVVDGPPGTGKSYTICAIVYLANQLGRSVVITSHKKQALDVIDQALSERFKRLHPRAKPSVLRLEKTKGPASLNRFENTLSAPVINAARARAQALNREAVDRDRERLHQEIKDSVSRFWATAGLYEPSVRKAFEWAQMAESPDGGGVKWSEAVPPRLPEGIRVDVNRIRDLAQKLGNSTLRVSLDSLTALFDRRDRLENLLAQCDLLSQIGSTFPKGALTRVSSVPEELSGLKGLLNRLSGYLEPEARLGEISRGGIEVEVLASSGEEWLLPYKAIEKIREHLLRLVELETKFLGKVFKSKEIRRIIQSLENEGPQIAEWVREKGSRDTLAQIEGTIRHVDEWHKKLPFLTRDFLFAGIRQCSTEELEALIRRLFSLEFSPLLSLISQFVGKPLSEMTFAELTESADIMGRIKECLALQSEIEPFARLLGMGMEDLPRLYASLKQAQDLVGVMGQEDLAALTILFRYYAPLLGSAGVESGELSTLGRLASNRESSEQFFRFVQLHAELSSLAPAVPPSQAQLDDYFTKSQKLLEHGSDLRLSNLMNHAADVQRIQTALFSGKRITETQARVLLGSLSCVISEPGLISQYFPMEPDMFDLLVIDEASQVSIAESISLMVRARQTIVFGDELQYGAVGAVNVSERYSSHYFKNILRDYALDRNLAISDEEKERIAREVSETPAEDDEESSHYLPLEPGTREWLKTFSVRTSTLAFAKALRNYSESLNVHFRSFPEIISYSNDFFYRESQIDLVPNRIRTKPIREVLRFIKVETKGLSGRNVNLDEIEAIQKDIEEALRNGYKGTIGVICSFREQAGRMEEMFRKEMEIYPDLVRNHRFTIWFVGDVQGEERDMVYYSFVQDKKIDNADLRTIYPILGGTADNIRRLKMQRLNVGFSRAKDVMVFVHSMPLSDYSDTRLGDALRHYEKLLRTAQDHYVENESIFGSPAEKELYSLIVQTPFFRENRDRLRLIAQFEIGKYIREEYHRNIPKYRVDFLLTLSDGGKEKSLIIEYDGVEFHTKNPDLVTKHNFDREYLEYDAERQLELESYGYSFLRINKFSLVPDREGKTSLDMLNDLLVRSLQ